MAKPKFVIEASEAESIATNSNLTLHQLLPSLVKSAQSLARPPISKYHVGAVGLGSSGRIFLGVNLEFPGLPLHHSIHAEQFLIANLSLHNETHLQFLAVSSAPCGHCRQFLQELHHASDIKILVASIENESESNDFIPLPQLLPQRFGPDDLLDKNVPLILEHRHNGLSLSDETHVGDGVNGISKWEKLKLSALEAANGSHAPYSQCPSGVAFIDSDGRIYKGSYMESAAYNPSLGPVQVALVAYVAGGDGNGYEKIVAAVLVEKEDAKVKQEDTARLLLKAISPECEFRVFRLVKLD